MIRYEDRYEAIEDIDVIISATASPHVVLNGNSCQSVKSLLWPLTWRCQGILEEAVSEMDQVELLTIDNFKDIIDEKMHYRERVAEKIALEIEEEIDGLMVWITNLKWTIW